MAIRIIFVIIQMQNDTKKVDDRNSMYQLYFVKSNVLVIPDHAFLIFHITSCYVTTNYHWLLDVVMLQNHCHIQCDIS